MSMEAPSVDELAAQTPAHVTDLMTDSAQKLRKASDGGSANKFSLPAIKGAQSSSHGVITIHNERQAGSVQASSTPRGDVTGGGGAEQQQQQPGKTVDSLVQNVVFEAKQQMFTDSGVVSTVGSESQPKASTSKTHIVTIGGLSGGFGPANAGNTFKLGAGPGAAAKPMTSSQQQRTSNAGAPPAYTGGFTPSAMPRSGASQAAKRSMQQPALMANAFGQPVPAGTTRGPAGATGAGGGPAAPVAPYVKPADENEMTLIVQQAGVKSTTRTPVAAARMGKISTGKR